MGNVLCKNKKSHTQGSRNTLDGILGRCTQICHNPMNKKKHFWDKQILETSPPCRTQPKANTESGWSTVTLSVPDGSSEHPIAPPRKKRTKELKPEPIETKSTSDNEDNQINSKIETENETITDAPVVDKINISEEIVIREEITMPTSIEFETKEKHVESDEKAVDNSTEQTKITKENKKSASPIRSILKIGNKKSDKFFGENLSESLSNEPITEATDYEKGQTLPLTSSLQATKTEDERNAEKLNAEDPSKTSEQKPIDDAKDGKDENDHHKVKILNVKDSEEMEFQINKEKGNLLFALESQVPKVSVELDAGDMKPVEEEIIVPVRRHSHHICDEDTELHNILHHHHKTSSTSGSGSDVIPPKKPQRDFAKYRKSIEIPKIEDQVIIETTLISNESKNETTTPKFEESFKEISDVDTTNSSKNDKILESYLTSDLIEAMSKQANDLSMTPEGYLPEDFTNSINDGSSQFIVNSKLTEKKSTKSQNDLPTSKPIEIPSSPLVEPKDENKLNLHIDDKIEYLPNYEEATGIPRFDSKTSTITIEVTPQPQSADTQTKTSLQIDPGFHRKVSSTKDISNAIKTFLSKDDHNPKDILKALEDEFGNLLNSSSLSSEDQELIKKLRDSVRETAESTNNNEMKENKNLEIKISDQNKNENQTIKIETQLDLKSPGIISNVLHGGGGGKRRRSIDDLDTWFSSNSTTENSATNDDDNKKIIVCRKRESSLPNVLESSLDVTKTNLNLNKEIQIKIESSGNDDDKTPEKIKTKTFITNKNDHSPLLKFLENEKASYNH